MRGKGAVRGWLRATEGITPAYAGKSLWCVIVRVSHGDHPRVCGEKRNSSTLRKLFWGSPPRMRGKAIPFSEPDVNFGITPAYAGKSQPYHFTCTSYWDHPRVCGEKQVPAVRHQRRCGSPPRMRGKVTRNGNIIRPWGITPAYAGKRHVCSAPCKGMGDHPRVCGEKASIRSGSRASQGSPPRMRGKGDVVCRFEIAAGITPAYAGKRGCAQWAHPLFRDHPRVCGEKISRDWLLMAISGSPPRMRGKD